MKSIPYAFALAALTAAASAQTPLLDINNHSWLIISSATHTTTARNYAWYLNNPNSATTGYFSPASAGGGATPVLAGCHSWRIIQRELDNRQEARQHKGSRLPVSVSVATVTPSAPFYFPEVEIRKTVLSAGRLNPDWSATGGLVKDAKGSVTLAGIGHYIVTGTLTTAVPFTGNDYAMTCKWEGGESDDIVQSQGQFGDYSAGVYTNPMDYGFSDPANVNTAGTYDFSVPWFMPFEGKTVICAKGDYAFRRNNTLVPTLYGASSHRLQTDFVTTAGSLGFDADGGTANAGNIVLFLSNFGPAVFTGSFNLLGVVIELNISDPGLSFLSGLGYVGNLDPTGKFAGPLLPLPALGAIWTGQYITSEAFVIDPTLTTVLDSSGSTSVKN